VLSVSSEPQRDARLTAGTVRLYKGKERGERMGLVRVRLVADTPVELDTASAALMGTLADRVRFHRPRRQGRQGEWLAYGTLDTPETRHGAADVPADGEMAGPMGPGWTR